MKYIITEEQSKNIDQSKVNMGPFGPSIRRLIDSIGSYMIDKYVVLYVEKTNDYIILLEPKSPYHISSDFKLKLTKSIRSFIPVDVIIMDLN